MNIIKTINMVVVFVVLIALNAAIMTPTAFAKDKTPGYNNKIPESVLTPDKVETRVGDLEFFDGIPTEETAALLFYNLDLNRGVDTFLNGMPAKNSSSPILMGLLLRRTSDFGVRRGMDLYPVNGYFL